MNHDRDLLGQSLLEQAAVGLLIMFPDKSGDLVPTQHGEDADIPLGILIGDVHPELIELVGGGTFRGEPDIPLLGFPELPAVRAGYERTGEREGFATGFSTDHLCSGGDVPPLVGTAHLQSAAMLLVKI